MENIEDIIEVLTNDPSLVDDLPNNEVDFLIDYLQDEIKNKEQIIRELEETN